MQSEFPPTMDMKTSNLLEKRSKSKTYKLPKFYTQQMPDTTGKRAESRQDDTASAIPRTKTVNKASFKESLIKESDKTFTTVAEKAMDPKPTNTNVLNSIIMGTVGGQDDTGATKKMTKAEKVEFDRKTKKLQEYN